MNLDKAREYYSDYFEGSLEPGLRDQFERELSENADVKEDYAGFVQAMNAFADLREDEVEVPFDLHDRILARVDLNIWEKERSKPKGLGAWWRTLALGGVAALGIIGTLYTIVNKSGGTASSASIVSGGSASLNPVFLANGQQLTLQLNAAKGVVLKVLLQETGAELSKVVFDRPQVDAPIRFTGAGGKLVKIVLSNGDRVSETLIAVPGDSATKAATNATVGQFAIAMASYYKVPVQVPQDKVNETVTYELSGTSAKDAPKSTISESKITVESRGGLIVILSPK